MAIDFEKVFRPSKWFVLFCALLVIVWVTWKMVANMRLADDAKYYGQDIFTWDWPDKNWRSQVEIKNAKVIKADGTQAVVEVKGRQRLTSAGPDDNMTDTETVDCSAVLTFYRSSNRWVLGRVELK